MRFDGRIKNNGWRTRFAILPVKIGDIYIWLERYAIKDKGLYTAIREYEGCAERVGYLCDCYRHGDN